MGVTWVQPRRRNVVLQDLPPLLSVTPLLSVAGIVERVGEPATVLGDDRSLHAGVAAALVQPIAAGRAVDIGKIAGIAGFHGAVAVDAYVHFIVARPL